MAVCTVLWLRNYLATVSSFSFYLRVLLNLQTSSNFKSRKQWLLLTGLVYRPPGNSPDVTYDKKKSMVCISPSQ